MNVDFFSAGNESCPQPQTSEHLAAIEIMKLKHILILQNKIDLIKEGQAKEQQEQILRSENSTEDNFPVSVKNIKVISSTPDLLREPSPRERPSSPSPLN